MSDDKCPICLELIAPADRVEADCRHAYCVACLLSWVEHNHSNCPYCNVRLGLTRESSDLTSFVGQLNECIADFSFGLNLGALFFVHDVMSRLMPDDFRGIYEGMWAWGFISQTSSMMSAMTLIVRLFYLLYACARMDQCLQLYPEDVSLLLNVELLCWLLAYVLPLPRFRLSARHQLVALVNANNLPTAGRGLGFVLYWGRRVLIWPLAYVALLRFLGTGVSLVRPAQELYLTYGRPLVA